MSAPWQDFPTGLNQPEGSYRFGQDALLLASFGAMVINDWASRKKRALVSLHMAELGCGCGAALFAFIALCPQAFGTGVDIDCNLVEAARNNAVLLGVEACTEFLVLDVERDAIPKRLIGQCQLVLANPPWRKMATGRLPATTPRQKAFFASEIFRPFFITAVRLLRHGGFFCCIIPVNRLSDAILALEPIMTGLRLILPVSAYKDKNPSRLLLMCQKGARPDPVLLNPLVLYNRMPGEKPVPTKDALDFCPWLR